MFDFCVPTLFGLESFTRDELSALGIEVTAVDTGKVYARGDSAAIAKANLWLRTGERVLILLKKQEVTTFDEMFELVKAIDFENYIAANNAFPVSGYSLNSKLFSVPDCQKIIKKAIVTRLSQKYNKSWFDEKGPAIKISFSLMKDVFSIYIDTTGVALHKRGYRATSHLAPIRETLAAGLVYASKHRRTTPFYDIFCGSGTIAIEAALIAKNKAVGLFRMFDMDHMPFIDQNAIKQARLEAKNAVLPDNFPIFGSDIDAKALEIAKANAKKAGVFETIFFRQADALKFNTRDERAYIITNPPYGERLLEQNEAREIYKALGKNLSRLSNVSKYIISSDEQFESFYGKPADKKRKLYNGMIKCNLYMYYKRDNNETSVYNKP